jgi:tetratricopeptide (TPR) repeat protein
MALIKVFNPHELSADIVLAVATGREKPLEQILSIARDNLSAPVKQHIIVSAPRGYGKSFFLRYVEVKLSEIARVEGLPLGMALLSEELPHVKEPETLIAEIRRVFLQEPAETVGVRWTEDDGTAWDNAVVALDAAIDQKFGKGRGLLIAAVENFDLLIRKTFAKPTASGRLREFLTRPGNRVMFLTASARGAFDRDYDRPLFKAFEEVSLQAWSVQQSIEFLEAQRTAAGKPALSETQLAKAKAVAVFISGTPRLATLIGDALLDDDPLGAADLLEKLVDELTPYYKERIDILPPRSQALLDALLRGGERCSATELSKRVGAPSQASIAAPLDDLKKDLVIIGEKAPHSAEVLLRVSDRVFAHYYRKRILSHGLEICPLEALVDILALIYSPEEKQREAEKFAARGLLREAALMTRLWEADRKSNLSASSSQEALVEPEFSSLMEQWDLVTDERNFKEGLKIARQAVAWAEMQGNVGQQASALNGVAWTLSRLGRFEEGVAQARDAAGKALAAGSVDGQIAALLNISAGLVGLGRYDEALLAAREGVEKAKNATNLVGQAETLRIETWCLYQLDRHDEAISVGREAAEKAAAVKDIFGQSESLRYVADCLMILDRFDEAGTVAREAASYAKDAENRVGEAKALTTVAWSLLELKKLDAATPAAIDAFEHAERVVNAAGDRQKSINEHVVAAGTLLRARPSDVSIVLRAYEWILCHDPSFKDQGPTLFFDDMAHVATQHQVWPALVALLEKFPQAAKAIAASPYEVHQPGRIITRLLAAGELTEALARVRHLVAALAEAIGGRSDNQVKQLWIAVLNGFAQMVASRVRDVAVLRELAKILDAHPEVPTRALTLIDIAAAYHGSGRDPSALARLDPDLATLLTTVFPATRPEKGPRKSRTKG